MEGTVQRKTRGFYQPPRGRGSYNKYNGHDDRVSTHDDRGDYNESRISDRGGRGYRQRSRGFSRGRGGYRGRGGRGRGGPRGGVHGRLGNRRPQNDDDDELDDDGCVNMDGDVYPSKKRFDPYSRNRDRDIRKGSRKIDNRKQRGSKISPAASIIKGRETHQHRPRFDAEKTWYQVKIFSGGDEVETDLIKKMSGVLDQPIEYRQYHVYNGAAIFYVLGKSKADALLSCDGKITSICGDEKLKVLRWQAKADVYSDQQLHEIKECVKRRVNIDEGVLDLSDLSYDENLNNHDIRLQFSRCEYFTIVVKALEALFGGSDQNERIRTLNLEKNNINYTAVTFIRNSLVEMFPNVNRLLIAENKINTVEDLKILRDWNLIELKIYDSNLDAGVSDSERISDARKIFADLLKLVRMFDLFIL